jgi:putative hydrolase of the HAD superfamily
MWQLVDELAAAGHTLILFSNINAIHAPFVLETYAVFRRFHGAVFSHEVGAIKPDERIYRHAIERFQLVPAETIYIDDLAANIATGERLGLQAFRYDLGQHQALLDWLAPRLAACPAD